ncbi:LemA family protein [Membranihabitans marinus]|uniref:LemA family protein n=1 Tax=Membranihabitans marinus TaxID=1227546 RepID=UPI001F3B1654|nr:LemA family protein [Membranihabitans marinus]
MLNLLIPVIILVGLILFGISIYNKLVRNRNMMEEGFSGVDVQLKKRHDLIPNLVNTVKGYASHESETLEKVMAARAQAMQGGSAQPNNLSDAMAQENMLSAALGKLMVVVENYPDLKADANFRELQTQLSAIEGDIEKSRRYYNATVRDYNISVESFPSALVANWGGFKKGEFFELEDHNERSNPTVTF